MAMPARLRLLTLALGALACGGPGTQPTPTLAPAPSEQPTLRTSGPVDVKFGPINVTEMAVVDFVVDGDTIRVRMNGDEFNDYAVRYIGVDAPERATEPLWQEATEANAVLIAGREVVMEPDVSDTDRYGRLLRHVWLSTDDGWLNIGAEMVRLGLADAKTYRPDTLWDAQYAAAEAEARSADRGIWALD